MASWDVVNESFGPDGSLRDCVWKRVIGPDYVEQAFRAAREADPAAALYLNEFAADTPNARFVGVEALARDFKARGVPLDGIGLQYHLYGREPFQHQTEEVLRRIGALGLAVHISELDDKTSAIAGTTEEKLATQGRSFQTVASACQAVPACTRVTTWGVSDAVVLARDGRDGARARRRLRREARVARACSRSCRPPLLPVGQPPSAPGHHPHGREVRPRHVPRQLGAGGRLRGRPAQLPARAPRRRRRGWSPVATGIRRHRLPFSSDGFFELQGTWRYRVRASDPTSPGALQGLQRTRSSSTA